MRKSGVLPVISVIQFMLRSIMDSVRSPRKSIFSSPMLSRCSIEYWVSAVLSLPACSGTASVRGPLEITTPAAWVDAWRGMPSTFIAMSSSPLIFGLPSYSAFSSGVPSSARLMLMPSCPGMSFAALSTSL
ncbi:hypothetical protein D3C75_806070 [compost metagenome]